MRGRFTADNVGVVGLLLDEIAAVEVSIDKTDLWVSADKGSSLVAVADLTGVAPVWMSRDNGMQSITSNVTRSTCSRSL